MHIRRFAVCLSFFAALGGLLRAAPAPDGVDISKTTLNLPHGSIVAEVFRPANQKSVSPILVLHGAGGTLFDGPEMRRVAQHLAAAGNAVYVVHYFERTGSIFAVDSTMQTNFETWLETVRESIGAIQAMRSDQAKVGIYGYSLGGFLALAAASDNARVGAVIEHAGGVWNNQFSRIGRMPKVLMIHGDEDARVPVAKYARPLIPILRVRAAKLDTKFFPGEGHVFSQTAMGSVRETAVQFFRVALVDRD